MKTKYLFALSGGLAAASAANAEVVLDNFTGGVLDVSVRDAAGTTASVSSTSPDILGGQRDTSYEIVSNDLLGALSLFVNIGVPEEFSAFSLEMGPGNASTVSLNYDGGGSGLDFDANGDSIESLRLDFFTIDLPVDVVVELTDGNGTVSSISRDLPASDGLTSFFALAQFEAASPGFDRAEIDGVEITFNTEGEEDIDLALDTLTFDTVVPAPGTLALLGLGGLIAIRRR